MSRFFQVLPILWIIFPSWGTLVPLLSYGKPVLTLVTGDIYPTCLSISSGVLVGHICKNRQGIRILTLPCFSPIFLLSLWILVLAWDPECDTTQQLPQWLSSNVDGQPLQFPPGPSKANRALSLILTGSPRDTTGLPMADCRFPPHMWISKLISLPEWRPMKYLITELSFSW